MLFTVRPLRRPDISGPTVWPHHIPLRSLKALIRALLMSHLLPETAGLLTTGLPEHTLPPRCVCHCTQDEALTTQQTVAWLL